MTDEMRQARINQNLLRQEGTGWDVGYGKCNLGILLHPTQVVFRRSYPLPVQ